MRKILAEIEKLAEKFETEIYLTGGAIRDILLDREINDFDFAVKDYSERISKKFAEIISGTYLVLDKENKVYRVVKNGIDYDFTAIREDNIKKNLYKRDFTINSIALHYNFFDIIKENSFQKDDYIDRKIFVDPTGGIDDLEKALIRVVGPGHFADDPLRILRAVRFKATLDFDIETNTEKEIINKKNLIKNSAPERVRDELFKIFSINPLTEILKYMDYKLKLLTVIFPDIKYFKKQKLNMTENIDIWTHILDMLNLYYEYSLEQKVDYSPSFEKSILMKFAIIFHAYREKNFSKKNKFNLLKVENTLKDLKFSNQEINYIKTVINYNNCVLLMNKYFNLTEDQIYNFFEEVRDYAPDILFLFVLDFQSKQRLGNQYLAEVEMIDFVNNLLEKYRKMIKDIKNPILTGDEIMDVLNISEGPLVGKYLNSLKKYQALGKINEKSDAINYIKKLQLNNKNNNLEQ